MADDKQQKSKILGGSLFLKVLILIAVGVLVSILLFGVPFEPIAIFWAIIRVAFAVALIILVFKGIESFFPSRRLSPTRSFRDKVIEIAIDGKPFNVKKLYMRGEDMRVFSYWGRILGLIFIPCLAGADVLKDGKFTYEKKKDRAGNVIMNKVGKPVYVHAKKMLTEKEGDWLFVVKRGILPFFGKKQLVRAHYSLVSDLGESTWIKCVNLVPVGGYYYPNQQWQSDMHRIKVQHQAEAVIETYAEFMDLLAQLTDMALASDPNFQKQMQAKSEEIANEQSGPLVRGG